MASMVPKGAPDTRPLEVADDSVDYWTGFGYVLQVDGKSSTKKAAKKTAAKKSSK